VFDIPGWDYRRLTIHPCPEGQGPAGSDEGAVDELLRVVDGLDVLEGKGWRLISIADQVDELGQHCYQARLKRWRSAAAANPATIPSFKISTIAEAAPSRPVLRRAA
jgi:hypothetical protein